MGKEVKFVKVTIIVEDRETVTTMRIPVAADVLIERNNMAKWDGLGHAILNESADLTLGLIAIRDPHLDYLWSTEVVEKRL